MYWWNWAQNLRGAKIVKTISFEYLQKRRFLILTVILTLASTLFSVPAFSFHKAFNAYLGESGDIIAIYNQKGAGPFTSFIPLSLVAHTESLDGSSSNQSWNCYFFHNRGQVRLCQRSDTHRIFKTQLYSWDYSKNQQRKRHNHPVNRNRPIQRTIHQTETTC